MEFGCRKRLQRNRTLTVCSVVGAFSLRSRNIATFFHSKSEVINVPPRISSHLNRRGAVSIQDSAFRSHFTGGQNNASWFHALDSAGLAMLPAVVLFAAPWLKEPGNLEDAYGTNRQKTHLWERKTRSERRDARKAEHAELAQNMQGLSASYSENRQPMSERRREITPYKDIVDQVMNGFHGKGMFRKARAMQNRQMKGLTKGKKKELKDVDVKAETLRCSAFARLDKVTLHYESSYPTASDLYAEVAFIGRSNVGKSCLLNQMSTFGTVAPVSPMPGKTKQLNWYRNRKAKIDIIDMPGYGYAARAKVFGPATLQFVKGRKSLKALYVLIDARSGFKATDIEWLSELGTDGPIKQVILTKCDMVPQKKLIQIASLVRADLEQFKRVEKKLILVSSLYMMGLHDLRVDIIRRCGRQHSDIDVNSPIRRKKDKFPFLVEKTERAPPLDVAALTGQPLASWEDKEMDDDDSDPYDRRPVDYEDYDRETPPSVRRSRSERPVDYEDYDRETPPSVRRSRFDSPVDYEDYDRETPPSVRRSRFERPVDDEDYDRETPPSVRRSRFDRPVDYEDYDRETPPSVRRSRFDRPVDYEDYDRETPPSVRRSRSERPARAAVAGAPSRSWDPMDLDDL
eukprot:TRINITY_DN8714_c0_g1_i12.p1 TRINITY_DN8714_c0_g1~~TRINITY_DN8714_c0_g1_i12.p1  ORF type:complete len:629 (+),score=61.64 TRINITY_DN8714_c0_g1_i12:50-1936(+)